MNTYFMLNGNAWPTLKQAIDDNARIFVLLLDYMQNQMRPSRSMFRVLSQMNSDNIEWFITGDIEINITTAITGGCTFLNGQEILDIMSITLVIVIFNDFNHHWVLWYLICCVLYVIMCSPLS